MNKRFVLGFIGFLLLLLSGCATSPTYVDYKPEGITTLQQLCEVYDIDWHWDGFSQVITLHNRGAEAVAMVGSEIVLIGDRQIVLSAPIIRKQSLIVIPPDFQEKVIGTKRKIKKSYPIQSDNFLYSDYSVKRFKKIIIDPGHGGKDTGAIGAKGALEKDVVLSVSKYLRDIFRRHGVKVIMTRDKDEFISLAKRTEIASDTDKADLFISIHANASTAKQAHGFEVYYMRNLDPKGKNEDQRRRNEKNKFHHFQMDHSSGYVKSIVSDMMYAHKQKLSPELAKEISHNTAQDINLRNRGEKGAGFYVLRNTLIPAVLIEIGFLSNEQEESKLTNTQYQKEIAESIAKNILNYDRKF